MKRRAPGKHSLRRTHRLRLPAALVAAGLALSTMGCAPEPTPIPLDASVRGCWAEPDSSGSGTTVDKRAQDVATCVHAKITTWLDAALPPAEGMESKDFQRIDAMVNGFLSPVLEIADVPPDSVDQFFTGLMKCGRDAPYVLSDALRNEAVLLTLAGYYFWQSWVNPDATLDDVYGDAFRVIMIQGIRLGLDVKLPTPGRILSSLSEAVVRAATTSASCGDAKKLLGLLGKWDDLLDANLGSEKEPTEVRDALDELVERGNSVTDEYWIIGQ